MIGQNVYFHLNHPIQFIYLVGVIVGIEDKAGKITIIDLDDGSGACIELKLSRTPKHEAGTTTAENVFVRSDLAQYTVLAGQERIGTGTVIKAKGTITSFRDQRQLDLKRVFVVKDTNDEAAFWAAATQYKAAVLSRPWILTKSERLEIDRRLMEEDKQTRAEEQTAWLKKRADFEREAARRKKELRREERTERKRQAMVADMDAGALI